MNIWFFIMLILAVAVVIGPMSMLRPSPEQRRKEALRLLAREKGLRFSMRLLPALKTDTGKPMSMPIYYLPPHDKSSDTAEWLLMRTSYAHEGNFYQEWDWQTDARPADAICDLLNEYLPKLPLSVPAISHGNLGTCVFWSEKEGAETLALLADMLSKVHQAAAPKVQSVS